MFSDFRTILCCNQIKIKYLNLINCEINKHIYQFFQRTLAGELDAGVGNAHQQGRFYGTSVSGSLHDQSFTFQY